MSETVAASSPAEVDVFNGQQPTMAEYDSYRRSGELPERFKTAEPAEPAPAQDSAEPEKGESDPESAPEDPQEKPQPVKKGKTASERVAQLKATIEQLWEQDEPDTVRIAQLESTIDKIEQRSGQKRKAEPAPAVQQPQAQQQPSQPRSYEEWEQAFSPEEWIGEYAKKHPEASYERANSAMFSHMLSVRDQFKAYETAFAEQKRKWDSQLSEAAQRYENFDDEKSQFSVRIVQNNDIPFALKEMLNDSEVLPHVIHVIAEDPAELAKFEALAKSNPTKAARYIAKVEAAIEEELSSGGKDPEPPAQRNEKGQFQKAAPPAKQQTQAPKPPSPVGGSAQGRFDVSDESVSTDEWMRKRNKQLGLA